MPRFRIRKQTVWRVHSLLGLVAGLGLLVIGMSGSLLMFSREIDAILRPEVVTVEARGSRLPMDELVGRVASAFPGHQLTGWALFPGDPAASDRAWMKLPDREAWLHAHIDPYTGRILSRPAESGEHFTGWLLELHYTFLADHAGMLAAGLLAVMLLLLGISGLWLYRDFFRQFLRLRWSASARILCSDLHKFIGITSVVFNLILGFTGAWWNLSHLIGHLFEEETPAETEPAAPLPPREWASLDAMTLEARNRITGFTTHYLSFPQTEDAVVSLHGRHGGAGPLRGLYGSHVDFDAESGEVRLVHDLRDDSAWAQIYDSFMPLHYGTFGGWPIRVLWSLGGLAPGLLAVSGFLIWWNRSRIRRTARP
jgi:uncharacterized iron-regulated membrane protein